MTIPRKVRWYKMSKIKGKKTKPELIIRSYLNQNGFHFGFHSIDLPGKLEIAHNKYNTVVFYMVISSMIMQDVITLLFP
jgi:DNA mismatch endonuclease (patch repair protein)